MLFTKRLFRMASRSRVPRPEGEANMTFSSTRWATVAMLAVAAAMSLSVGAQQGLQGPQAQFERARLMEENSKTLNEAIVLYKQVAAQAGSNRALAAQALLRAAECYQKLGDVQARGLYEQLVRDYADQKDVVTIARARLGGGGGPARSAGDRAVWTGSGVDIFGTVSPDGRFLTYTDWARTNNLMLRDLVAGTDRPLTNNVSYRDFGYAQWSAISRDGEQVAYEWVPAPAGPGELRLASLRGSAIPSSRRIRQSQGKDSIRPFDWSPDGKWIAVLIESGDSSQIGLVSVQDGALRRLKSIDWRGVNKVVFSPDGRFIAYDLLVGDARDQMHAFVMAIDGSRESVVVEDPSKNHVMGWSPDGHLLFASDRSGTVSLWALPIENGKAQAAPTLVKANIGSSWSLGLTPSGTLYVLRMSGGTYVRVVPIDMNAGTLLDSTSVTFQRFVEARGRPDWSSDGKHLLYMSCGGGPCTVSVRSMETGVVREVPHRLTYLNRPRLAPDGHAIVTEGTDLKGRPGIYLIDARTGETSLIAPVEMRTRQGWPDWSADGKRIRFIRQLETRDRVVILEREIGSEETREIFRIAETGIGILNVSPDGRFVAYVKTEPTSHTSSLLVTPIAGGAPTVLVRATDPKRLYVMQWTPDSQAVVLRNDAPGSGNVELWLAPLTGEPRPLNVDTRHWDTEGYFELHPDGRQVAFVGTAGEPGAEVWALENFLPAQAVKR